MEMTMNRDRMSRRTLMRAALLGLPASALLAACGAPTTPAAAPTAAQAAAAAAPTPAATAAPAARGTLRVAHVLEWAGKESLQPAHPNRMFPTIEMLYSRIVRQDPAGQIAPDLAESWEADATATAWTFKLRPGVKFHDGRPLTSKDVAYTIRQVVDPELGSPGASVLTIVDMAKLATPDDQTIIFHLTQPHADFPLLLLHYSCYIIPEGSAATIGTSGIGTGPFKLQAFAPEGKTVVVSNDDYWEGPPAVERVEIVGIADSEGRVSALLADQTDFETVAFEQADLVKRNTNYVLQEVTGGDWLTLVMRTNVTPFDDVRVRMAMKLVVDRPAMLKTVLQGYGRVASDHPVWPGDQYYLELNRPQDIAEAKALLAEAGHVDGLDVTLYTSDSLEGMVSLAVTYKEMAALAGINVEIKQTPADGYWNDIWLTQPFCVSSWGERQADQVLNELYRNGADWNETAWDNAPFEKLLDDARRELDPAKRKALYQQAERQIADEGGSIIPMFSSSLRAMNKRLRGINAEDRYYDWAKVSVTA
jgi:peptide/nickel transport system substrate-binding protein